MTQSKLLPSRGIFCRGKIEAGGQSDGHAQFDSTFAEIESKQKPKKCEANFLGYLKPIFDGFSKFFVKYNLMSHLKSHLVKEIR